DMDLSSYRPSRRTFLQAAAAGVLVPALGVRGVAASEPTLAAGSLARAGTPPGLSIVDAHIHLWDLSEFPVPWIAGNPILNKSYVLKDSNAQSAKLSVGTIVYGQTACAREYSLLDTEHLTSIEAKTRTMHGLVADVTIEIG